MATERLRVILELEAGQYKREAREAATATGKLADSTDDTATKTGKLKDRFSDLGTTAKVAIGVAATAAVGKFFTSAVQNATKLSESVNAVNKVFGDAADKVLAFGEISAQVTGLSQADFQQLSIGAGGLLQNFGFSAEEAADQAIRLTTRAADLASVFNTEVPDALEAIGAGLRGETEPLRRFNVNLSDAAIRAKAVELGLADTTAEVDQHGKATAALELIYEQTASAQGDFIQTSNDLANAQRRAAAEAENASARFGAALQGPLATVQDFGAKTLNSLSALGLFGETNAVVAQNALRVEEAIDVIVEAAQKGEDPLTALADGILHIARNGELTTAQFEALAAGAGLNTDQFESFNEVIQEQGEALGLDAELLEELEAAIVGTGESAEDAEGDMEGLTDETEAQADAAAEAAQAQRDLKQAYLESANPIFAAQGALERLADAQANLTDVQGDAEASAEDVAAAELELARAALEAQGALDALGAGDVDKGIAAIADALGKSDDEARALLEALGLIDGTDVTTVVTTRYNTVGRPPSSLPSGPIGGFRAFGGDVRGNVPYMVGERGPEIFEPNSAGRIIPLRRIDNAAVSRNVSSEFNISLEGTGDPVIDSQRIGSTAAVLRRMEQAS